MLYEKTLTVVVENGFQIIREVKHVAELVFGLWPVGVPILLVCELSCQ